MEDKGNKIKSEVNSHKLEWEKPMLICLDKAKTEGGHLATTTESYTGKQS